jgi:hypothetical protein
MKNLFLLAAVLLVGCSQPDVERANHAGNFSKIVLLDVQGLWGGRDLWLSENGTGMCRVVGQPDDKAIPGLQEKRYRVAISPTEVGALRAVLGRWDFSEIESSSRSGIPDEARPRIYLDEGNKVNVAYRWNGDIKKGDAFQTIYVALKKVVETATKENPVHSGALDWKWYPEGFPKTDMVRSMEGKKK